MGAKASGQEQGPKPSGAALNPDFISGGFFG
jgi:hypothetical protein